VAVLIDTNDPASAETTTKDLQAAAHSLGLQLHFLNAGTEGDFDAVFARVVQMGAGGLVIGAGVFFHSRSEQLAALTVRQRGADGLGKP
jgi:putative ABC transport system substrate-binding protein